MNTRYRIPILFLLTVVLLLGAMTHAVRADHGPKPSIDLTVINAPQEEYYIALLEEGSRKKENSTLYIDGSVNKESLEAYLENFCYESYEYRRETCRYKEGKGDATYEFHYDAPETFRVIVIRFDGTVTVSEPFTREKYHAKCTYDYATGTITEEVRPKVSFEPEDIPIYLRCYLLTLVIEFVVLWIFRFPFKGVGWNVPAVVGVNLLTNVVFSAFLLNARQNGIWKQIMILECIIAAVEAFIYKRVLVDKSGKKDAKRIILYAIVANALSALTMLIPWL